MKRWTAKNWLYIAEMPYKRALGGKSLPFLKPSEEKMAMNSIIFIDDRVQDKQALFSTIDESTKWFVLDSSLDGINQMQRMLSSYRNLDSIQIISHGSTGAINIGSTLLNNTTLPYYQTQLQAIGSSLKETGDLLLYGCDVAKGDEGQKFITDLAKVTGADVAASNDLTGSTSLGGNLMNIHTEFDTAESNFGIDANNDGIIGALSSIDSSGSVDLSVDSVGNIFAGNVAVKTYSSQQIHTGIYGTEWTALAAETIGDVNTVLWQHESGALHTWQTDANWQWVSSEGWWGFGSTEFDTAESNFGIDANNDGIIGALSSIELEVSEAIEEEIVPVICICWREEDLYYLMPKDIALIVDTDENITSRSIGEEFTLDTLNADSNYSTLISDVGNGQTRDFGNDVLAINSTTPSNIDAIVDFVMATDNIQINNSIFANSEMLDAGLVKNQFFNDQDINSSVADTSYFDPVGSFSGAPVQITILGVQTQPTVEYSNFAVIA